MKRFKNILCVLPVGQATTGTLERAVSLAENNQATLTVAALLPPTTVGGDTTAAGTLAATKPIEALITPLQARVAIQPTVLTGIAFLEIIRAVLRHGHDLVIKPAQPLDLIDRLFGSDDMHLLRKCPCAVWLTKDDERANYRSILAAVDPVQPGQPDQGGDGAPLHQRIIELASSLALSDFAGLHIVHAWDAIGDMTIRTWSDQPTADSVAYIEAEQARHQQAMRGIEQALRAGVGEDAYRYLAPTFHLLRGPATRVVPAAAKDFDADLVVMGTVGRTGIAGLFIGNTAETILNQLRCSVLAIKPVGFVTPVTL